MDKTQFFKIMDSAKQDYTPVRKPVKLGNGITLSIQASDMHYCHPRKNDVNDYEAWEIGFPSQLIGAILEYAEDPNQPTETVYACVPTDTILVLINNTGGTLEIA